MRRLSSVTRKGQVTIPVEIRRAFEIGEGDQIAFEATDGEIRLFPLKGDPISRTAGAFQHDGPPMTAEELREAAAQAIAEDADKSKWQ